MQSFEIELGALSDEEAKAVLNRTPRNRQDSLGVTALAAAVKLERVALVRWLMKMGHSPFRHGEFVSPIGAAIHASEANRKELLQTLLEGTPALSEEEPKDYCPDLNEPVFHAVRRRGYADLEEVLLEKGASIEWRDSDGTRAGDV